MKSLLQSWFFHPISIGGHLGFWPILKNATLQLLYNLARIVQEIKIYKYNQYCLIVPAISGYPPIATQLLPSRYFLNHIIVLYLLIYIECNKNDYHTKKITLFIRPHTTQQSQKFIFRKKDLIEKYLNCEVCPHLLVKIGRVEHPVQSPLVAKLTLEDHLKQNWLAISHSSVWFLQLIIDWLI